MSGFAKKKLQHYPHAAVFSNCVVPPNTYNSGKYAVTPFETTSMFL